VDECKPLMCGLPGAGKSTLARALAARVNADEACDTHVTLVSFDENERQLLGTPSGGEHTTSTSTAKVDSDGGRDEQM
jgi:predicted kinase